MKKWKEAKAKAMVSDEGETTYFILSIQQWFPPSSLDEGISSKYLLHCVDLTQLEEHQSCVDGHLKHENICSHSPLHSHLPIHSHN